MVPEPDRWDGRVQPVRERATQGLFSLRLRRVRIDWVAGPDGWIPLLPCEKWIWGWVGVPEPRNTEMPRRLSDGGDRQVRFPTPFAAAAPPLIGSW